MSHIPGRTDARTPDNGMNTDFESRRERWHGPPQPHLSAARRQRHRGTPWYAWALGGCLATIVVLVLLCAVLAGAIGGLIFHFAHRQNATDTAVHVLQVGSPPSLTIDVDTGSVHLTTGRAREVQVTVTRRASNATTDDARHDLARVVVDVRQAGDDIAITARVPQVADPGMSLAADVAIAVPQLSRIAVRMGSGDAQLDDLHAAVSATVTSGNLRLTDVTLLAQSTLDVRDGSVMLNGTVASAASARVHVEHGPVVVSLTPNTPVSVSATTQAGSVSVIGWSASPQRTGSSAWVAGVTDEDAPRAAVTPGSLLISVGAGDISVGVG